MMITGAAVPTLVAEALKQLEERLQALKKALMGPNTYFPFSIFADQILKQIPDELPPLYDGPYPGQESPLTEAAWDAFFDLLARFRDHEVGVYDGFQTDMDNLYHWHEPYANSPDAYYNGRVEGHLKAQEEFGLRLWIAAFLDLLPAFPANISPPGGFGGGDSLAFGEAGLAFGMAPGIVKNPVSERMRADALEGFMKAQAGAEGDLEKSKEAAKNGGSQTPKGTSNPKLKWGNPKSTPTYGHTFSQHGQKQTPKQLIDRANGFERPHQVGQWLDDKEAADFLSEAAKKGEGVHDVKLPSNIKARSFLPDGTELKPDMAKVIVKADGSIRTAYPYSSLYPTN